MLRVNILLLMCSVTLFFSCQKELNSIIHEENQENTISINKNDKLSIKAIYNALNGENWEQPWDLNDSITWKGVTIAYDYSIGEYRIISLTLTDPGIGGYIPDSIKLMTELRLFQIQGKNVKGSLPEGLFNLIELREINIFTTSITTERFEEFHRLKNLSFISISDHSFNKSITGSFEQLEHLKYLYLANNNFTGPLPNSLMTCKGNIYLHDNNITEVPIEYWSLPCDIALHNNKLSGEIPIEIQNTKLFKEKYRFLIGKQQLGYGYTNIIN
ncbi:MAG: hypothetical protein RR202_03955 [Bacteroidales bacterium]